MRWVGDHFDDGFNPAKQAGPDMTEPIMYRLGFVRVHGGELRRLRCRLLIGRIMVLATLAGVVGMGVYAHGLSSRARIASETSIPEAFNEISNHTASMSETIRQLSTLLSATESDSDEPTFEEETPLVKPERHSDEQKSRVPWSDLF